MTVVSHHLKALPNPGGYAHAWATLTAIAPTQRVRHPDWTRGYVTAGELRAEMRRALDRRINARGGDEEANTPIPDELVRDARRLDDIKRRIRVYQFETKGLRSRFGHLLASNDD